MCRPDGKRAIQTTANGQGRGAKDRGRKGGTKKGCPLAGASLGTLRCLRAALETGRAGGRFLALHHLDRAMVVAMVAVRVVQVAVDQVVDVVTVRDGFVAATGAMDVAGLVTAAFVLGRAAVGVGGRDGDHVLVDVVAMRMVQVAVVQVIDMAIMADGRVAAAGAMGVVMVGVMGQLAFAHDDLLSAIDDAIIYP